MCFVVFSHAAPRLRTLSSSARWPCGCALCVGRCALWFCVLWWRWYVAIWAQVVRATFVPLQSHSSSHIKMLPKKAMGRARTRKSRIWWRSESGSQAGHLIIIIISIIIIIIFTAPGWGRGDKINGRPVTPITPISNMFDFSWILWLYNDYDYDYTYIFVYLFIGLGTRPAPGPARSWARPGPARSIVRWRFTSFINA